MKPIYWKRFFRRTLAVFLAVIALWLLGFGLTVGAHSGVIQTLGSSESFVLHALQAELGDRELASLPLALRLAARQSPLLWANLTSITPVEPDPAEDLPNAQPALTGTTSMRRSPGPPLPPATLWSVPWCPPTAKGM